MFCPYCGTLNPDDAVFCHKCGKALPNSGDNNLKQLNADNAQDNN
ncbi:MAG: zinc-ribbon domain-containing protein, partial [Desulfurella sp.]